MTGLPTIRDGYVAVHPLADGMPPPWAVAWGEDELGAYVESAHASATVRWRWLPPRDSLEDAEDAVGLWLAVVPGEHSVTTFGPEGDDPVVVRSASSDELARAAAAGFFGADRRARPGVLARVAALLRPARASGKRTVAIEQAVVVRLAVATRRDEVAGVACPSWATEFGRDAVGVFATCELAGVVQRMRWIPPGAFLMGSPKSEPERFDDETQHRVVLTSGYWFADTACTQELWRAVTGASPSTARGAQLPVEQVSFDDVQAFLQKANALPKGRGLRLPTEAEWEYACRAGTTTPFSFGATIDAEQVNYDGDYPFAGGKKGLSRGATVPVGSLPPNPWGLYEMHGNVWEWVQDFDGPYDVGEVVDPVGPLQGHLRVFRGGCFVAYAQFCRSAQRNASHPGLRWLCLGFRLARGQD